MNYSYNTHNFCNKKLPFIERAISEQRLTLESIAEHIVASANDSKIYLDYEGVLNFLRTYKIMREKYEITYVRFDKDSNCYGVFGTDSGFCYYLFDNELSAKEASESSNFLTYSFFEYQKENKGLK